MKRAFVALPLIVFLAAAVVGAGQGPAGADRLTAEFFQGLELRTLGPSLMTGRVAVEPLRWSPDATRQPSAK